MKKIVTMPYTKLWVLLQVSSLSLNIYITKVILNSNKDIRLYKKLYHTLQNAIKTLVVIYFSAQAVTFNDVSRVFLAALR